MPGFVQTPWFALAGYLLAVNLAAFGMFWWDKRAARLGRQRIPERRLLILAALGGTPGAKAGQRRFRHKTYKQPFRTLLNVIAGLQIGLLGLLGWMAVQGLATAPGAQ